MTKVEALRARLAHAFAGHGDGPSAARAAARCAAAARVCLRHAWLADASAEHASVASFARFALELMAVGAPGGLVACSSP